MSGLRYGVLGEREVMNFLVCATKSELLTKSGEVSSIKGDTPDVSNQIPSWNPGRPMSESLLNSHDCFTSLATRRAVNSDIDLVDTVQATLNNAPVVIVHLQS